MAKVWKVPAVQSNHRHSLPLPLTVHEPQPFYSLFKKVDNRWFQIRTVAYSPEYAVKVWGDFVCANPYSYSIRQAVISLDTAQGISRFRSKVIV